MIWTIKYAFNSLKNNLMKSILVVFGIALGVMLATTLMLSNESIEKKIQKQVISDFGDYDLQFGYNKNGEFFAEDEINRFINNKLSVNFSKVLIPYVMPNSEELLELPSYWGVEEDSPDIKSYKILEGHYPKSGAEVAITEAYLENNNISVGDYIQMQFPNYGQRDVLVVGKLSPPSSSIMGQKAFFPLDWLQKELQLHNKVNLIQVKTNSDFEKQVLVNEIEQAFNEVKIDERLYLKSEFNKFNVIQPILFAVGLTSLLIVALLIMGSFFLSVQSRKKQWILLRVLGGKIYQIIGVILLEAFLIGVIGSMIGVISGYLLHLMLNKTINNFLNTNQAVEDINFNILIVVFFLGVMMSIIGAFLPALTTRKIPLVHILKAYNPSSKKRERIQNMLGLSLIILGMISGIFGGKLEVLMAIDISPLGGFLFIIGLLLVVPLIVKILSLLIAKPILKLFEVEAFVSSINIIRYRYKVAMSVSILAIGIILSVVGYVYTNEMQSRMEHTINQSIPADIVIRIPMELRHKESISFDYKERLEGLQGLEEMATLATDTTTKIIDYDFDKADQKWLKFMKEMNYQYDRLEISSTNLSIFEKVNNLKVSLGKEISEVQSGEGIITNQVAKYLGVQINDEIKIMSKNNKNAIIKVVSILENNPRLQNSTVLVHEEWALQNSNIKGFESFDLILNSNISTKEIKDEINGIFQRENVEVINSTEILNEQNALLNNIYVIITILVIIIFLISCMGLINSIVSSIFERIDELGVIRAIGATPTQIQKIIVLEGFLLSMIGSIIGIVGGLIIIMLALSNFNLGIAAIPFKLIGILFVASIFIGIFAGLIATVSLKMINMNEALKDSNV